MADHLRRRIEDEAIAVYRACRELIGTTCFDDDRTTPCTDDNCPCADMCVEDAVLRLVPDTHGGPRN